MKTTQPDPKGFFTLGRREDHWWLITPADRPFFSLGINHIDPETMRYPESIDIWRNKYGGSTIRWIRESVAQEAPSPEVVEYGLRTYAALGILQRLSRILAMPVVYPRCTQ